MSPKIFSLVEKDQLKDKMFYAGLELLKEHGMTHMSVKKITATAGIGKSTFYNFFLSKEDFVLQLIEFNRNRFWKAISDKLGERDRLTVEESKDALRAIISNSDSVYQYLTPEDKQKMAEIMTDKGALDIEEETETLKCLFLYFEGVRADADYAVISNLFKILALTVESRSMLHEGGYKRTQDKLFDILFDSVFEEGKHE